MNEAIIRWVVRHSPSRHLADHLVGRHRRNVKGSQLLVHCSIDDIHFDLKVDTTEIYGYLLYMMGQIEPVTSYFLRHLMRSRQVLLDIGANVGYYTVLAAKSNPGCQIWSFEPAPSNFSLLRENTEANRLSTVSLHQLALGEQKTTLKLNIYQDQALNAINTDTQNPHPFFPDGPSEVVQVPCTTVDSFMAESGLRKVDVMKLDVEGYEYFVLKGATNLLADADAPILLCEIEPLWLTRFGLMAPSVIGYIEDLGYQTIGLTRYGLVEKDRWGDSPTIENYAFVKGHQRAEIEEIGQEYYSGLLRIKSVVGMAVFPTWRSWRRSLSADQI